MNYYERHIGDYLKDTAHLTLLEHGVYTRLMDVYYTKEVPLPVGDVARLIGARAKDERAALDAVLSEFFVLVDGSHVQERCAREIAKYQAKAQKNREVGKLGGRPRKTETIVVPEQEPTNNHDGFKTEPTNNPPQYPVTSNQYPVINTKNTSAPPDGVSPKVWADFLKTRKTKITDTAIDGIRREANKAGISLEAALETSCARGWQSFRADWMRDGVNATKTPISFKQSDDDIGMARWEEMTGRIHPDRKTGGRTIDITPRFQEIGQ